MSNCCESDDGTNGRFGDLADGMLKIYNGKDLGGCELAELDFGQKDNLQMGN